MALNDIICAGLSTHMAERGAGTLNAPLDMLSENNMAQEHVSMWPAEADVKIGVDYGPTGDEYQGTYVPTGGGAGYSRGRVVSG